MFFLILFINNFRSVYNKKYKKVGCGKFFGEGANDYLEFKARFCHGLIFYQMILDWELGISSGSFNL